MDAPGVLHPMATADIRRMHIKNGTYFINPRYGDEGNDLIYLRGVGVDELVDGHALGQNGGVGQYILIYFHTETQMALGDGAPQAASGSFILLDRNAVCTYGSHGVPWRHSWLVLGGSAIDGLVAESGLEVNHLYRRPELSERFVFYCQEFYREAVARPEPIDQKMLTLMTEMLLHDLARGILHGHRGAAPPALRQLEDYLETHLDQRITLAGLARQCFLSVPRFSALCRRHFGHSPIALLNHKRMMRAALLLRDTTMSVGEVAVRCGFANQLYFSSRFHQYWQMSPRRFRQENHT